MSTSPKSPRTFEPNQKVKDGAGGNIAIYQEEGRLFIWTKGQKDKIPKVIAMDDLYAIIVNGSELKLETCPRSSGSRWNPFRSKDQV